MSRTQAEVDAFEAASIDTRIVEAAEHRSMLFADLSVGDFVVWDREQTYGGPVTWEVTAVRPKRFDAVAVAGDIMAITQRWKGTFRRSDGRTVGMVKCPYFVRPELRTEVQS